MRLVLQRDLTKIACDLFTLLEIEYVLPSKMLA